MKNFLTLLAVSIILIPQTISAQCSLVQNLTTGAGSTVFHDLPNVKGGRSYNGFQPLAILGKYYFSANANGAPGGQLWETDGNSITLIGADPNFGPFVSLVRTNDRPAFIGTAGGQGFRSNLYDHKEGNLNLLSTIGACPGGAPLGYQRFRVVTAGGKTWYRKLKCSGGADLFAHNGYVEEQITNQSSFPHLLTSYGGNMFFVLGGGASHPSGTQLWKKNIQDAASPAQFVAAINFNNPRMNYLPALSPGGGRPMLFIAEDPAGGQAVYATSGGAPVRLAAAFGYHDMLSLGNVALFIGKTSTNRPAIYLTNGNSVTFIKEIALPNFIEDFEWIVLKGVGSNAQVIFSQKDAIIGNELYLLDVATRTVSLVRNIHEPFSSGSFDGDSNPANFMAIGKVIYFTANDGNNGRELWRTDGTHAGTWMVQDLRPGGLGSDPQGLIRLNSTTLLFVANDGSSGTELWKLDVNNDGRSPEQFDATTTLSSDDAVAFKVAPNPTTHRIQIFADVQKIDNVQLLDINGRMIRDIRVNDSVVSVDISSLQAGMYLLRATTHTGGVLVKKVIKQ